ncbi:uncharacterized protein C12orf50 homolog [Calonectris borealis]|uniref:uncharacterized protein C12orf50 homolog n=1 Tax=Calonectris borealis TaxID=1323832 RepID=UPI003F4C494A
MEIKEDVQAGQVTERHHADVMSWRSGWQPWKCNILYRLATAFVGSTSLEKVPPPLFKCILLSVGVLIQKSSRAKVLKVPFLKENYCLQDKVTICLNVDRFNVFMYVLLSMFMVIFTIPENCFLLQQKYSNNSCFWETQTSGCVRINCAFHHSKPRNINGLFLPPSNNAPLQQGVQEGILHPAHRQEPLRNQEHILLPIHPPLIINLNDEEDEEDDEEEENYVSDWVPKTAEDIEEERAIKEICYKSGEYYRIQYPHEHQSTKTVSSPQENELLPLEATERDLQKGDGTTIPTKFNNTKREEESSGRRAPIESVPRTDCTSFENGGGDCSVAQRNTFVEEKRRETLPREKEPIASKYSNVNETNHTELVKNHHCEEVKEKKWISEEPRNSPHTVTGKGIHTSDPKVKPSYQQGGQSKDDETASSMPYVRETGRKTYFNSSEPRRSAYVVYRTVTVTQEPKFNGSTDKYTSGSHNAPTWRKRNPHAKTFSKFKTTIQRQEDMEVNRKGERYVDRRKRWSECVNLQEKSKLK